MISKCRRHSCFDQLLNSSSCHLGSSRSSSSRDPTAMLARVPESVLEPLTTVPIVMKSVQSMSLSMTPVKRYGNPESGCESYMPAAHSELPNSIPLSVPKPLKKLEPPDPTVVQSYGETVYP
ncbi:hypothetical protein Tco_0746874 [Tanacetum coccineum]